ncbi:tetratricopeptide repeat protein [Candidatus Bipolaricaulota bacterium]|nr:tetratricopeptide repeat protein [Candidatus Bipolaricaulota bacterium]
MSEEKHVSLPVSLLVTIRESAIQLEHDGRASLAIRLLKQLLKDGDSHLPVAEKARSRAALGGMVWKQGSVGKAHALAADALSLAEECDDPMALSEALFVLGEVTYIEAAYMGRGDLDTAMTYHQRCLEMRLEVGNRHGESLSLSRIGVIHERRDEREEARACHETALAIAEELDFPDGMSRPLVHIGAAKETAGDLTGALADYQKSVAAVRRAHDVHALAFDLCNVAWATYRLDGELESALKLLSEALELAEGMGSKLAEMRVHQVTGEVCAVAGQSEKAKTEYEVAIDIGNTAGFMRFASFVQERLDELDGSTREETL